MVRVTMVDAMAAMAAMVESKWWFLKPFWEAHSYGWLITDYNEMVQC